MNNVEARNLGYFKGELRPCPIRNKGILRIIKQDFFKNTMITCSCGLETAWYTKKKRAIEDWNNHPTEDKLIDALITSCEITELHAYYIVEQVTMLTGLTWPEALEIYHKRRSQDER